MKTVSSIFVRLAFLVGIGAVWGCGHHSASQLPAVLPPTLIVPPQTPPAPVATNNPPAGSPLVDCGLFRGQSESTESITTVGLTEGVDPTHAPYPTNESERLLFRQVYETLVRADCQGHAAPGLADSWRLNANGDAWIVTLRPNARFSDNRAVTAMDVVSSWTEAGVGAGNERELRKEVRRLVRSVAVVDDRTLEIALQSHRDDAVVALAHTDLAIATPVPGFPGSPWPMGTRAARVESDGSSVITISGLSGNSSIRFLINRASDSRDLLDRGVDLLLTRDPRTIGYAATLTQFQMAALPWQRTHVLIAPKRIPAPSFSTEDRSALARDAVRGEARGADGPYWWESLSDCDVDSPQAPPAPPSTTSRIVYNSDDSAARELAERLVGIGKYPRASGLTSDALAQALRRGNESAYILSLDRHPLDSCREIEVLMNSAGWLDPHSIVPLVDTRLQAIVRRGRSGLTAEWDGSLLLELRN